MEWGDLSMLELKRLIIVTIVPALFHPSRCGSFNYCTHIVTLLLFLNSIQQVNGHFDELVCSCSKSGVCFGLIKLDVAHSKLRKQFTHTNENCTSSLAIAPLSRTLLHMRTRLVCKISHASVRVSIVVAAYYHSFVSRRSKLIRHQKVDSRNCA